MTEASRPWDGVTVGDSGPYTSAKWQELWQFAVGLAYDETISSVLAGTGTYPNLPLEVTQNSPAGASVLVKPGAALVKGIFHRSDADVTFTISSNASGNPRIDSIVLEADYLLQKVRLKRLQGTPAVTPSRPSITQTAGVLWQVRLADIAVANGFATITTTNITNYALPANIPEGMFLNNVLNNSGSELKSGDVVVIDTATDRAATTTTRRNAKNVVGVWSGLTANGSRGRVQIGGIALVNMGPIVHNRGAYVISDTTAKKACAYEAGNEAYIYSIGYTLTTTSATNSQALVWLTPQTIRDEFAMRKPFTIASLGVTMASDLLPVTLNGTPSAGIGTFGALSTLFTSGAAAGNAAGVVSNSFAITRRSLNPKLRWAVLFDTSQANYRLWMGFTTAAFTNADTAPGSCAGIRYSSVVPDSVSQFVTRDGATQNVQSAGAGLTPGSPVIFEIEFDDAAGKIYFRTAKGTNTQLNSVLAGRFFDWTTTEVTANLPAAGTDLGIDFRVINTAAAAKTMILKNIVLLPEQNF